jgi:hypothetical protein
MFVGISCYSYANWSKLPPRSKPVLVLQDLEVSYSGRGRMWNGLERREVHRARVLGGNQLQAPRWPPATHSVRYGQQLRCCPESVQYYSDSSDSGDGGAERKIKRCSVSAAMDACTHQSGGFDVPSFRPTGWIASSSTADNVHRRCMCEREWESLSKAQLITSLAQHVSEHAARAWGASTELPGRWRRRRRRNSGRCTVRCRLR